MSDEKRTLAAVTQEYSDLCAKAGHVQYQIIVFERDLTLLNDRLQDLQLEAASLKASAPEAEGEKASG